MLLQCFDELAEQPERQDMRYVVALLLVRRRVFRLEEDDRASGGEVLRLHCPRRDASYEVPVVIPDPARIDEIQQQVAKSAGVGSMHGYRSCLWLAVLSGLMMLGGAGCAFFQQFFGPKEPPALPPSPSIEQVIQAVNLNNSRIQSFQTNQASLNGPGMPTLAGERGLRAALRGCGSAATRG